MKKHELIITDIDGTLLNIERNVAPETITEIQRIWTTHNVPTVLASGRMSKAMHYIKRDIGLAHLPMISYNGALIQADLNEDGTSETLFSKTFSATEAKNIYRIGKDAGVQVGLYSFDDWHVEQHDKWTQHEIDHTKIHPEVTNNENILTQWELREKGLHKIMLIGPHENINQLEGTLRAKFDQSLKVYRSNNFIIEICPDEVTKETGVKFVCDFMKINPQNVIAFGDNMNDKAMLEYVGTGVAVGNAKPPVKAIADDLTDTNLELGVAKALRRYF